MTQEKNNTVETIIARGEAKYDRSWYIKIVTTKGKGTTIEFDCSDEEYGPIKIPYIEFSAKALSHFDKSHK